MSEILKKEDLEFDGTITTSSKGSAILGRITGPCADIVSATRNGRKYSEALWEKVFQDDIIKEYFASGGIFGELNHPADREETDLERVAICMPEPPVKKNGKLIGSWDILNTPCGRVAKCLFDYGYKLGISSRGSGDTYTDYDGQESVDPETYTLQGFDLVMLPAVKSARLSLVTESLSNKNTFKKALNEALAQSTEEERKIMTETLDQLEIDYSTSQEEDLPEEVNNKEVVDEKTLAADDAGANVIEELQEALKQQQELEKRVKTLQEKLSVCYTKEARYSEVLSRTNNALKQSEVNNQTLQTQIQTLTNSLNESKETINTQSKKIKALQEHLKTARSNRQSLNENLKGKDSQITELETKLSTLTENHNKKYKELEVKNAQLNESLQEKVKDSQIFRSQSSAKLSQAQKLVEKYKAIAKTAIDKYIKLQAMRLGVNPEDIKNKLNENYSFSDIDTACENLQKYKLTVNALPFNVSKGEPIKMQIRESKEVIKPVYEDYRVDDDIDETLRNIIN